MTLNRLGLLVCTLFPLVTSTPARSIEPIAILQPSDVPVFCSNGFGFSVDISGRFAVVGAPRDPCHNGDSTGAVYIFHRQGTAWTERAKLVVDNPTYLAQLGWSVAMDDDVVVAGAPRWDFDACDARRPGTVFVFRRNDGQTPNDFLDDIWTQEAELSLMDPEQSRGFGMSVAVDGHTIVAGSDCGEAAAVFRYLAGSWVHEATLVSSDPEPWESFGAQVAVAGDVIAVLAPGDTYPCNGFDTCGGSVNLFRHVKGTWTREGNLIGSIGNGFGPVALSQNVAVIGAPGRAHVFRQTQTAWQEVDILRPSDNVGQFGSTLAITDNCIIAGVMGDLRGYVFHWNSPHWEEVEKLFSDEDHHMAVAADNNYAILASQIYAVHNQRDLADIGAFQNCFGFGISFAPEDVCGYFDFDANDDIGLLDFEFFVGSLVGPVP